MPVITVNALMDECELGITLPHEHLFIDARWACQSFLEVDKNRVLDEKVCMKNLGKLRRDPYIVRDNSLIDDEELVVKELLEFKKAGGRTIVDQSSVGVGRSPTAIRNVSNLTGINIVMGCGYYTRSSLPEYLINESEPNLLNKLIYEIRNGVNGTGIKPGIIGEIGVSPVINEWDKKSLRIASKAHQETGLPISIHIQAVPLVPGFTGNPNGMETLAFIGKLGVNLEKVGICHTDARIDIDYIREIVKTGAFAEFDHFGEEFYIESADFLMDRDYDRIKAIRQLISEGYEDRLLLSQDICFKTDLVSFGGWGFAHIVNNIVPIMLRWGISLESIKMMMEENPKKILSIENKYL